DGTFSLVNSGSMTDADLAAAAAAHEAGRRRATLVVKPHDPLEGYRPVEVAPGSGSSRVTGIAGRRWGGPGEPRTFTGIHVIEPDVLEKIPNGGPSDINAAVYPVLLDDDAGAVGAWLERGWWFEAGSPSRYLELNLTLLDKTRRSSVVGPGFFLDEEAAVERSVVGEGARLHARSRLSECVLWEGVTME